MTMNHGGIGPLPVFPNRAVGDIRGTIKDDPENDISRPPRLMRRGRNFTGLRSQNHFDVFSCSNDHREEKDFMELCQARLSFIK